MLKTRTLFVRPGIASRGGFTAIEISAVATIIAIMALILIPILQGRIEESRRVAALDDMQGIEKAESIAFAQTNMYFRLEDLTRSPASVETIPPASWNAPLTTLQTNVLTNTWAGPYYSIHKSATMAELVSTIPQLFRSTTYPGVDNGPMLIMGTTVSSQDNYEADRAYPVDPWGNPYIFFGSGIVGTSGGTHVTLSSETNFNTPVIYSMGPDGMPGDGAELIAENFFRETGALGTGDDLKREF